MSSHSATFSKRLGEAQIALGNLVNALEAAGRFDWAEDYYDILALLAEGEAHQAVLLYQAMPSILPAIGSGSFPEEATLDERWKRVMSKMDGINSYLDEESNGPEIRTFTCKDANETPIPPRTKRLPHRAAPKAGMWSGRKGR